jgi:hypothetical protein
MGAISTSSVMHPHAAITAGDFMGTFNKEEYIKKQIGASFVDFPRKKKKRETMQFSCYGDV